MHSKILTILFIIAASLLSTKPLSAAPCNDGSLDQTFGTLGTKVLQNSVQETVRATIHDKHGRILLAGSRSNDAFVRRLLADGQVDTAFGQAGFRAITFSNLFDTVMDLAIQSDGKIIALGYGGYFSNTNNGLALARLNPNGSLDQTFGVGGKVFVSLLPKSQVFTSVGLQRDGKIVVGGFEGSDPTLLRTAGRAIVARFNSDGNLDLSFASSGLFVSQILGVNASVASITLDNDDRILFSGSMVIPIPSSPGYNSYVGRLSQQGQLDVNFNASGIFRFFNISISQAIKIHVSTNSKITLIGSYKNGIIPSSLILFLRILDNGQLDGSFGTSGFFASPFVSQYENTIDSALQFNEKIAFGFYGTFGSGVPSHKICRLSSTGNIDTSFGSTSGCTDLGGFANFRFPTKLNLNLEDKIVLANTNATQVTLKRICNSTACGLPGTLDTGFGFLGWAGGGTAPGYTIWSGSALNNSNDVIVSSFTPSSVSNGVDQVITKVKANGIVDPTFASSGDAMLNIPGHSLSPTRTITLPDNRIVTAGDAYPAVQPASAIQYLSIYKPDGTLDSSFNGVGWTTSSLVGPNVATVRLSGLGLLNNKIYISGRISYNDNTHRALWIQRYNLDGTSDLSFGTSGLLIKTGLIAPTNMLIGEDGFLYFTGLHTPLTQLSSRFVAKLFPDGSLDTTYGTLGLAEQNGLFGVSSADLAYQGGIYQQADGKILLTGADGGGLNNAKLILMRFNTNGTPDSTFGVAGLVNVGTAAGVRSQGRSISVDGEGRIIVGGIGNYNPFNSVSDLLFMRFTPNGTVDTSFGTNGVSFFSRTTIPPHFNYLNLVLNQPANRLLGFADAGGYFNLARICR